MSTSKLVNHYTDKWKDLCEGLSFHKIASTYFLSQMLSFPEWDRYQINKTTFLRCLSKPKHSIGNILILQGGVRHEDSSSYYVRTACSLIPSNIQVFLFEKQLPVADFDFAHDVAKCITFMKEHFNGPVVVVGYSMGGILLYNYLSLGYDQADLYIPTCCPLDLNNFRKTIHDHTLFRYLQRKTYRDYGVRNFKGLLKLAGSNIEKHERLVKKFITGLNKNLDKWVSKTVYIISAEDPITLNYCSELDLLEKIPLVYRVKDGWHCCLNSIFLSVQLAFHYLEKRHKGYDLKPEQIPVH